VETRIFLRLEEIKALLISSALASLELSASAKLRRMIPNEKTLKEIMAFHQKDKQNKPGCSHEATVGLQARFLCVVPEHGYSIRPGPLVPNKFVRHLEQTFQHLCMVFSARQSMHSL
jgi:hypothetical protein